MGVEAEYMTQFGTGDLLVLDCETGAILPGNLTPPLVSVGVHGLWPVPWYLVATAVSAWYHVDVPGTVPIVWRTGRDWLRMFVASLVERCGLATHRGSYDLGVIVNEFPSLLDAVTRAVFQARVYDCRIAEARILRATYPWYAGLGARHPLITGSRMSGTFVDGRSYNGTWLDQFVERGHELHLNRVSTKYGGPVLDKSVWSMRFLELVDLPVDEWPGAARMYCLGDLTATGIVQRKQCAEYGWRNGILTPQTWQAHREQCREVKEGRLQAIDPRYAPPVH